MTRPKRTDTKPSYAPELDAASSDSDDAPTPVKTKAQGKPNGKGTFLYVFRSCSPSDT